MPIRTCGADFRSALQESGCNILSQAIDPLSLQRIMAQIFRDLRLREIMFFSRPNILFPLLICALLGAANKDHSDSLHAASCFPHKECGIAARPLDSSGLHCIKPTVSHVTHIQGRRIFRGPGWNACGKTTMASIVAGSPSSLGNPYPANEHLPPQLVLTPLRC